MAFAFRAATAADAAPLAEFAERTFRETFGPDNRPEDMERYIAVSYGASRQRAEILDPALETVLAEAGAALAGFVQLRRGPAPACVNGPAPVEVWRFYVDRPWQGRGLAARGGLLARLGRGITALKLVGEEHLLGAAGLVSRNLQACEPALPPGLPAEGLAARHHDLLPAPRGGDGDEVAHRCRILAPGLKTRAGIGEAALAVASEIVHAIPHVPGAHRLRH